MRFAFPNRRTRTPAELEAAELTRKLRSATRELGKTPEIATLSAILMVAALVAVQPLAPATLVGFVLVLGVGCVLLWHTVRLGSSGLALVVATYLVGLAAVAVSRMTQTASPVVLVLFGVLMFACLDLARCNFARRRMATIDGGLLRSTFGPTLAVAAASLLSVGLLDVVAGDGSSRSWFWIPWVSLALVVLSGVVLFLLTRSSARGSDGRRWMPGASMVPPPKTD